MMARCRRDEPRQQDERSEHRRDEEQQRQQIRELAEGLDVLVERDERRLVLACLHDEAVRRVTLPPTRAPAAWLRFAPYSARSRVHARQRRTDPSQRRGQGLRHPREVGRRAEDPTARSPAHARATLLLASGANAKVVSERLGHSSVAFTLDTYAHAMPGQQADAAAAVARLVDGSK